MSTIDTTSNLTAAQLNEQLKHAKPLTEEQIAANNEVNAKQQLKQEDFFALLSKQLSFQDPFKPVDNSEMVAQMASFTTAQGVTNLGTQFSSMTDVLSSSQALQASSLVGKKVLTSGNSTHLSESGEVSAVIRSPTGAQNVTVSIKDQNDNVVRTLNLGDISEGNKTFSWDGLDEHGQRVASGKYTLTANGLVSGKGEDLETVAYAHVESVNLGGGQSGVTLNLQGLGSIKLSDAIEVAENN